MDFSNDKFNPATSTFSLNRLSNDTGFSLANYLLQLVVPDAFEDSLNNPDNVLWTERTNIDDTQYPEGLIFICEDNYHGSVWQIEPNGDNRVAIASTIGNGEATGVVDISEYTGHFPGSVLLVNSHAVPSNVNVLINPSAALQKSVLADVVIEPRNLHLCTGGYFSQLVCMLLGALF